jgi:hypothetical protein
MASQKLSVPSLDDGLGHLDTIPLMQMPETAVTDTSWLSIEEENNAASSESALLNDQA